jgi:hypothetical protein
MFCPIYLRASAPTGTRVHRISAELKINRPIFAAALIAGTAR